MVGYELTFGIEAFHEELIVWDGVNLTYIKQVGAIHENIGTWGISFMHSSVANLLPTHRSTPAVLCSLSHNATA